MSRIPYFWRDKSYCCPLCGWQGTMRPTTRAGEAVCPECETLMRPRPWWDTWGVTLLILALVVATVMFVGYFGQQ